MGEGKREIARLVDVVQQAVIATDVEGRVTFWSAYAERLFGWTREEALGRSIVDLTPHESSRHEAAAIMERLARGESWSGDFLVRRKDGTSFTAFVVDSPILDESGRLVGIVGVSTDVSQMRAIEAQLRQARKLEVVGRLAGAVAHDFNNLLTVVFGNLDLLSVEPTAQTPVVQRAVTDMVAATTRAATITRQLLSLSKKEHPNPTVVDVAAAIRGLEPLLRRLLREDVELRFEAPETALWTRIDRSQLDQLVLRLVLEARDAMPSGGRLAVSLAAVPVASGAAAETEDGAFVKLTVSDTGTGVSPDHLATMFEPFLSRNGETAALGLPTVQSVVEQAGGVVEVQASPEETRFLMFLPRASPRAAATPSGGTAVAPRRERILLVEDQEELRMLTARILGQAGFRVVAVPSAEHAIELGALERGEVDLLLTDIVLGGANGVVLAERVRGAHPTLPVVFMTGYSEDDLLARVAAMPNARLVPKPFRAGEIVTAVQEALGGAR